MLSSKEEILRGFIEITAKRIKIDNTEFMFSNELLDAIRNINNNIYQLLDNLINVYADWYDSNSNSNDPNILTKQKNRDTARNKLVDELNKV